MLKKRMKVKLPSGKMLEVYTIGELAFRVGRTTTTIRRWEIQGIIPPTCFHDANGCRMYSLEQINLIVDTATKCRVTAGGRGRSITQSGFPEKLSKPWYDLIDKYMKGEDDET